MLAVVHLDVVHLAVVHLVVVVITVVVITVIVPAISFWPHWSQLVGMINLMIMIMPTVNLNLPVNHRERET